MSEESVSHTCLSIHCCHLSRESCSSVCHASTAQEETLPEEEEEFIYRTS